MVAAVVELSRAAHFRLSRVMMIGRAGSKLDESLTGTEAVDVTTCTFTQSHCTVRHVCVSLLR